MAAIVFLRRTRLEATGRWVRPRRPALRRRMGRKRIVAYQPGRARDGRGLGPRGPRPGRDPRRPRLRHRAARPARSGRSRRGRPRSWTRASAEPRRDRPHPGPEPPARRRRARASSSSRTRSHPTARSRQKQPYFHLHLAEGDTESGASGLAVDTNGYLYVSTRLGVQVCDQAGRVNGILARPGPGPLSRVAFAGPERDVLYVVAGDRLYKRKARAKGVPVLRAAGQARGSEH